jgi:hypothetical protein
MLWEIDWDRWYWMDLIWWLFWVAMAALVWFIVDRLDKGRRRGNI